MRVLIVDDEQVIADTMGVILRSRGFVARAVYSAENALLAIEDFRPVVVISDIMMPGMNGIDLAIQIGIQHPDCKVLLLSGNPAAGELLDESLAKGHVHIVLAKPVHPEELLRAVSNAVAADRVSESGGNSAPHRD
jgi:CheY-like chemotaxis protein